MPEILCAAVEPQGSVLRVVEPGALLWKALVVSFIPGVRSIASVCDRVIKRSIAAV